VAVGTVVAAGAIVTVGVVVAVRGKGGTVACGVASVVARCGISLPAPTVALSGWSVACRSTETVARAAATSARVQEASANGTKSKRISVAEAGARRRASRVNLECAGIRVASANERGQVAGLSGHLVTITAFSR
jgi:hypothetical protein